MDETSPKYSPWPWFTLTQAETRDCRPGIVYSSYAERVWLVTVIVAVGWALGTSSGGTMGG